MRAQRRQVESADFMVAVGDKAGEYSPTESEPGKRDTRIYRFEKPGTSQGYIAPLRCRYRAYPTGAAIRGTPNERFWRSGRGRDPAATPLRASADPRCHSCRRSRAKLS